MDIIQESKNLAISEIEKFGLPALIHFEISEKKALELAEKLKADKKIVQIGIYLIDLKLGQAFKEGKTSEHVQLSIKSAKEFLDRYEIDEPSKDKIINCIEAHHKDVPFTCLEAEICANADCYRFIHPKGFFGFLTILGERNSNFFESLTTAENKMDEKYNILSLGVCKQELENHYQTLKNLISEARSF